MIQIHRVTPTLGVIPAKAGTSVTRPNIANRGPRFRGDDPVRETTR
jgi:hypothetical protein